MSLSSLLEFEIAQIMTLDKVASQPRRDRRLNLGTMSFSPICSNEVLDLPATSGVTNPASSLPINLSDSTLLEDLNGGKITEVNRGRSVQRIIRVDNPFAKSQSRYLGDSATIELNAKNIEARQRRRSTFLSAFHEDSRDPRANLEDDLLEPCPDDLVCWNVSDLIRQPTPEITKAAAAVSKMIPITELDDTCYRNTSPQGLSTAPFQFEDLRAIPTGSPESLVQQIPTMSRAVEHLKLKFPASIQEFAKSPAVCQLPQEIVRQILYHLSPPDFNSARHACRLWYISSLELHILETMIRRGGWSTYLKQRAVPKRTLDSSVAVNDEWLLSKHIARECALGPDWTGTGCYSVREASIWRQNSQAVKTTPFIHTSITDFTDCAVQYPLADDGNSGLIFTVSTCGKFLILATGCLVYVYQLNQSNDDCDENEVKQSGALIPITSLMCPRRVLACSMDTSSQRYAIAVLMDARMGMVCDITNLSRRYQGSPPSMDQTGHADTLRASPIYRGGDYRNRISIKSSRPYVRSNPVDGHDQRFTYPVIAAAGSSTDATFSEELQRNGERINMHKRLVQRSGVISSSCTRPRYSGGANKRKDTQLNRVPVEQSVPTMYAPLCSADDPPRSVALCPQRRCVAFGCSSGIELHWVDALTGQDLNRWFPLTAPSDFLYFLPPRAEVNSAKKLRLISSAGIPSERPVIAEEYDSGIASSTAESSGTTPHWRALSDEYSGPRGSLAAAISGAARAAVKDNRDHFRAVPLSDGCHILFTDPSTGLLCLGIDDPLGGPTKLLRKVRFAGPQGGCNPVSYAGSSSVRYGVRVVCSYGSKSEQSIWLFSVPGDVFTSSLLDYGITALPCIGNSLSSENENREWIEWWNNRQPQDQTGRAKRTASALVGEEDRIWPVQVRGQEIGKCRGLTALAIHTGPEMTIWAFSKDGLAQTWQIDDGNLDGDVKKRIVAQDGTVQEFDRSGDTDMNDAALYTDGFGSIPSEGRTYDGTSSMSASANLKGSDASELQSLSIKEDGETLMTAHHSIDCIRDSDGSSETITLSQD